MKARHRLLRKMLVQGLVFAASAVLLPTVRADDAAGSTGRSTDGFPYEAYVCVDEADVVAGPGYRYYVTARLPRGTRVEVYSEEPSGWLAIRPPEGSFSWVPADFVERHPNHPEVGKIKATVGSWIGTTIERVAQHRQHVTLQNGEPVHILGEKVVRGPEGEAQGWLKIAPPAGEFRWIHVRDVRRGKPPPIEPPPQAAVARPDRGEHLPESGNANRQDAAEGSGAGAGPHEASTGLKEDRGAPPKVRTLGSTIPLHDLSDVAPSPPHAVVIAQYAAEERTVSGDGFVPRRRRPGSDDRLASAAASPPARAITSPRSLEDGASPRTPPSGNVNVRAKDAQRLAVASSRAPHDDEAAGTHRAPGVMTEQTIGAEEVARRLEQLEVELALMLARDRSQWNLAALRDQALVLVERGADPAWRGRARMLVDRIEQIADTFQTGLPSRPLVPNGAATPGEVAPATRRTIEEVRYDAQGWLKEVVSRQANRPPAPYAVVDAQGRPVCFVSPVPGLNLHRYLNRQVGLFGRRGWLTELQKPHLVAERVIELDR